MCQLPTINEMECVPDSTYILVLLCAQQNILYHNMEEDNDRVFLNEIKLKYKFLCIIIKIIIKRDLISVLPNC